MSEPEVVALKPCTCGKRIPLRPRPEFQAWLRSLPGGPPADLPVETWRCRCRTITILTVADLGWAA